MIKAQAQTIIAMQSEFILWRNPCIIFFLVYTRYYNIVDLSKIILMMKCYWGNVVKLAVVFLK